MRRWLNEYIKRIILIIWGLALPLAATAQNALVSDADDALFAHQLIGDWVKCAPDYTPQPTTNTPCLIHRISFKQDGIAMWSSSTTNITGQYVVAFERPPGRGAVTLARITLLSQNGQSNTFSRVNFGLDNRLPDDQMLLRIEGPGVYQVFKREKKKVSQQAGPGYPPQGVGSPDP